MEEKQSIKKKFSGNCFDWQLENYDKEMFMSGYVLSNKPVPDLLQNCDLPPPLKLFSPIEENFVKFSSFFSNTPLVSRNFPPEEPPPPSSEEVELTQDYNTSLLKALHLSQTRAREAEKEFAKTNEKNQTMTIMFLEESLKLSAHKNWVTLLETENYMLRKKKKKKKGEKEEDDVAVVADVATWYWAIAICIGITGVGFALGNWFF